MELRMTPDEAFKNLRLFAHPDIQKALDTIEAENARLREALERIKYTPDQHAEDSPSTIARAALGENT